MSESISFIQRKSKSLLKLITELEKKHKIAPHSEAKVIWNEFLKYHELVLEKFGENSFIPVVDYDQTGGHYHSGDMIQIMKTTIQGIEDALGGSPVPTKNNEFDAVDRIKKICNKFHIVARQLRERHDNRETLDIEDEYDVQDLLHALLKIDFDDIRKEEWTPNYAGASSRMDFLLKNEQIVVETKKTRKGLGPKEIGEQLLIDIQKYRQHSDCKTLFCFVYDPEGKISNPEGIERDLSKETNGMHVLVLITPKGY